MTLVHINIILNQDTVMLSKTMTLLNASCFIHVTPLRLCFRNGVLGSSVCIHQPLLRLDRGCCPAGSALLGSGEKHSLRCSDDLTYTWLPDLGGGGFSQCHQYDFYYEGGRRGKENGWLLLWAELCLPPRPLHQKKICMLKP